MTLLVFKVNQLGDNVVFLPVIQSLVGAHPGWRIVVCTSPLAAPLYRVACPQVEVLEFDTHSFNGAWRRPWHLPGLLQKIRQVGADACLVADDQSNVALLLARLSGARLCVGPDLANLKLNFLLHRREPISGLDSPARQNWRIAQALLRHLQYPELPDLIPAPDLSAFGKTVHGSVMIHAGASRDYKRWPLERYMELANRLCKTQPVMWVTQGHAAEKGLDPRVNCVKPASLAEFIRLIAGTRLFIGNNSGPMHLASALNVPGVILTGPSPYIWDPFWHREHFELLRDSLLPCQPCDRPGRPANVCTNLSHPRACLDRWSVDQVYQKVCQKLA